jgi:hypothetical protein
VHLCVCSGEMGWVAEFASLGFSFTSCLVLLFWFFPFKNNLKAENLVVLAPREKMGEITFIVRVVQKHFKKYGPTLWWLVHTCNPSTLEAEAGGSLQVQDQCDLHSKFQTRIIK